VIRVIPKSLLFYCMFWAFDPAEPHLKPDEIAWIEDHDQRFHKEAALYCRRNVWLNVCSGAEEDGWHKYDQKASGFVNGVRRLICGLDR
jgi:hypothetical protein